VGRVCSAHGIHEKCIKIMVGNMEGERYYFGELDVDRRIILK
jgi:hypothetical protein